MTRSTTPAGIIAYPLHGNLYLNITSQCTLRCTFCPKHNRSWEVQEYDLSLKREPSYEEVIAAIGDPAPYKEIVFCGLGEPTQRLVLLLEVARWLKARGARVRVNTDGLANLVHGRDVTPEMVGLVDSLSISLNGQNEEVYERHTHPKIPGTFPAMLEFARLAHERGMAVTLTAIDGLAGVDIEACRAIAERLGVAFRRRVLDQVG
ncbi:MAG TPA: TatD family nuclease-associated radical SAM protein [Gammaproteobacteria bacterium]